MQRTVRMVVGNRWLACPQKWQWQICRSGGRENARYGAYNAMNAAKSASAQVRRTSRRMVWTACAQAAVAGTRLAVYVAAYTAEAAGRESSNGEWACVEQAQKTQAGAREKKRAQKAGKNAAGRL